MGTPEQPQWLTIIEAAKLARCSTKTIQRRLATGQLTRKGLAGVLIDRDELLALIEEGPTS